LEGHITALFASVLQYVLAERQHDAEKCQAVFSDDIMLYLFDLETDSDFRSIRTEIIRL
jgi:hypothetical protein